MTHVKGLAEDDGNRWGSHGVSIIQHWGGGEALKSRGPIRDGGLTSTCVAIRGKGGIMAVDGCVGLRWGALKNYEDVPIGCVRCTVDS